LRVKDGFDFDDVKADVEEALETNFDPIAYDASGNRYFDAGGTVHPDDIRRIVLSVEGVAWFTISSPAIALALDSFELPILGTVTITEG
jgi:uncharacterized phage protein gp47/JayE